MKTHLEIKNFQLDHDKPEKQSACGLNTKQKASEIVT